jgi:imidazolonepropionase-like amidohydrolase
MTSLFALGGCACCTYSAFAPPSRLSRMTAAARSARFVSQNVTSKALDFKGGNLRIDHATVINPRDGSVLADMTILVKAGQIIDVLPSGAQHAEPDAINAAGKFVVPGYNDMHNHALQLDDPTGSLALMLAEGVTGFRQMAGSAELLAKRRGETLELGVKAPALLEMPGEVLTPMNAGTPEAAIAEVQRQKAQGADFVKIVFVAPAVFFAAVKEARRVGIAIVGHLQEGTGPMEASMAGFRSVEHMGPGSAIWTACSTAEEEIRAELAQRPAMKAPPKIPFLKYLVMARFRKLVVNPLAYANPLDVARLRRALETFSGTRAQALAERFVADGSWQVPTLVRVRAMELAELPEYEQDPGLQYLPPKALKLWHEVTKKFKALPEQMRETCRMVYPRQLGLAKLFSDAGVSMMTGSDGGSLMGPGLTLQQEFGELAEAGISPLKILQMTTVNVADYLGRPHTMGTVEIGREANLVILDANPLESVKNLGAISGVVRAGVLYSAAELQALKARVAAGRGYLR